MAVATSEAEETRVPAAALERFAIDCLRAMGCDADVAAEVGRHLVEADLAGVSSHGTVRLGQYAEAAAAGRFAPAARSELTTAEGGGALVDGGNGFGMPAMRLATEAAIAAARAPAGTGLAMVGVANVFHTGRIGAFAEQAAAAGCFALIFGGGARADWRQVAPFGGARAVLPTNPYAFGAPAGPSGPVVLDIATSAGAGGKVLAAAAAGRALPPGLLVDAQGRPSTDPADYRAGGALLPMAGPKGYGMALIAELVGEAISSEARLGMNWLVLCADLARFRAPATQAAAAEVCLAELRACPPAEGFAAVQIPGARERATAEARSREGAPVPSATLAGMRELAARLGVDPSPLETSAPNGAPGVGD